MARRFLGKYGLHDLPLAVKGLAVAAIPLLGLLSVSIAFYLVHRENQAAEQWVRHTVEVRSEIQAIHSRVEEAETGVLGYLLSHDMSWLAAYRDAEAGTPRVLNRLATMVADNPAQLARAQQIRTAVGTALVELRALMSQSRPSANPETLANIRESLALARAALDAARDEEDRLLQGRREHAQRIWKRGYALTILGILLVPAGAILSMFLFTAAIAHRIRALDRNARHLARGAPIAPMRGGTDELGRLEQALAHAATLLAQRQAELRRSRDELETNVQQRTAELAETNRALEAEVAERERAQEELGEANQRLRAVIDASPLAIVRLDLEGNIQSWNRAAENIFGWTADEVLNRPLPTIPEDERQGFHRMLEGAAHGEILTGYETRRRRKDGALLDVRLWTAPLRSATGAIRGKVAIIADFTEHRKLEQQLVQAQKMEAIGRLAGGVAHDFNNVITIVSGYGHILRDELQDDPDLRDAADEILKAADRAASLASQLLAFSRRQVIQPKVIDLNALVHGFERMLGRVIGEDVELRTVLRPDLGLVRADAGQLEQVVMNLAVNARDAMPEGGKLTIETANVTLDENYARTHAVTAGPYVMLAVSDTGTGMDAETQAHIFEPFFTTKERGKGTGLGLSTVYGIVKQHSGDIWVYTEPGRGSTFKVYLPRVVAEDTADPQAAASAPAALRGHETVLLVEDEEGVRRLVKDILEGRGYRVLEAQSVDHALEIGEKSEAHIDLLVTDVIMPKMSGRDLAEVLTALRPDMKVLYLSGYTDHVVVDHGVLQPGIAFLQKPFTPDALAHKVREVLDNHARGA